MIDRAPRSNYCNYMASVELKITRIGNSRGVRIPAATLERYEIGASVIMEERSDGILLRPVGSATPMLSWEDTAREMATAQEEWSEWDATLGDGLDSIPWQPARQRKVAESANEYGSRRPRKK
jgi:antitoxin component of MazEF toxin-antitoxin module